MLEAEQAALDAQRRAKDLAAQVSAIHARMESTDITPKALID